jgi:hypothetical protein
LSEDSAPDNPATEEYEYRIGVFDEGGYVPK